jgi:hypothetical protein
LRPELDEDDLDPEEDGSEELSERESLEPELESLEPELESPELEKFEPSLEELERELPLIWNMLLSVS